MTAEREKFDYLYMNWSGEVYELMEDERNWLESEVRPVEFWLQRQPVLGKFGGYVRRDELEPNTTILAPRSYHSDRSHPLPDLEALK